MEFFFGYNCFFSQGLYVLISSFINLLAFFATSRALPPQARGENFQGKLALIQTLKEGKFQSSHRWQRDVRWRHYKAIYFDIVLWVHSLLFESERREDVSSNEVKKRAIV